MIAAWRQRMRCFLPVRALAVSSTHLSTFIEGIHRSHRKTHTGFHTIMGSPSLSSATGSLRTHQAQLAAIVGAIAAGEAFDLRDLLASVTPGGGRSLLPVIAAARLIEAGVVDRLCWVVPRDSLRLQAEEAFNDATWRERLGDDGG